MSLLIPKERKISWSIAATCCAVKQKNKFIVIHLIPRDSVLKCSLYRSWGDSGSVISMNVVDSFTESWWSSITWWQLIIRNDMQLSTVQKDLQQVQQWTTFTTHQHKYYDICQLWRIFIFLTLVGTACIASTLHTKLNYTFALSTINNHYQTETNTCQTSFHH